MNETVPTKHPTQTRTMMTFWRYVYICTNIRSLTSFIYRTCNQVTTCTVLLLFSELSWRMKLLVDNLQIVL